jgi:hypothetical protein
LYGFCLRGAVDSELEEGSSAGDFERWTKGALGIERFPLKRLHIEGIWGELLYREPWKIC